MRTGGESFPTRRLAPAGGPESRSLEASIAVVAGSGVDLLEPATSAHLVRTESNSATIDSNMPVKFEVDQGTGIIRTRAHGRLTTADMAGHVRAVVGHPDAPKPHRELWDGTAVTELAVASSAARDLLSSMLASGSFSDGRIATVATGELLFGMTRMVELLTGVGISSVRFRTFRELGPAERWLLNELDERED